MDANKNEQWIAILASGVASNQKFHQDRKTSEKRHNLGTTHPRRQNIGRISGKKTNQWDGAASKCLFSSTRIVRWFLRKGMAKMN